MLRQPCGLPAHGSEALWRLRYATAPPVFSPARETDASKGQCKRRACFPSLLHKPSASNGRRQRQRLVLFRPPRALTVSLRRSVNRLTAFHFAAPGTCGFQRPALLATPCFPSLLRKPFRRRFASPPVLLRLLRSHLRCLLAALGALPPRPAAVSSGIPFVIPAKAGIRTLRIASLCYSALRFRLQCLQ